MALSLAVLALLVGAASAASQHENFGPTGVNYELGDEPEPEPAAEFVWPEIKTSADIVQVATMLGQLQASHNIDSVTSDAVDAVDNIAQASSKSSITLKCDASDNGSTAAMGLITLMQNPLMLGQPKTTEFLGIAVQALETVTRLSCDPITLGNGGYSAQLVPKKGGPYSFDAVAFTTGKDYSVVLELDCIVASAFLAVSERSAFVDACHGSVASRDRRSHAKAYVVSKGTVVANCKHTHASTEGAVTVFHHCDHTPVATPKTATTTIRTTVTATPTWYLATLTFDPVTVPSHYLENTDQMELSLADQIDYTMFKPIHNGIAISIKTSPAADNTSKRVVVTTTLQIPTTNAVNTSHVPPLSLIFDYEGIAQTFQPSYSFTRTPPHAGAATHSDKKSVTLGALIGGVGGVCVVGIGLFIFRRKRKTGSATTVAGYYY